jgi:hypothetical protein
MTLTEAAYWSKRFGVVIGAILGVIIITLLIIFYAPKESAPAEYIDANCACTDTKEEFLSEELEIPSLELGADSELVFQVETTTGQIDSLPKIINVYKFDNPGQSLNSQLQATEIANNLGFNPDGIIRKDENTYVWLDTARNRTLEVDARTLNFTLTTDSDYIREISSSQNIPSDSESISIATNALRQANLLDDDYSNDDTSFVEKYYIDINPDGTYSEAASSGDADLIRIDFKRRKSMISILETVENSAEMIASLEKKLIGTDSEDIFTESEEEVVLNSERVKLYNFSTEVTHESPVKANISVYVGPQDNNEDADTLENVYRIEYINWPIQEYACGTYELISPSEAIQKIQDGEGSLVYLIPKDNLDRIISYQVKTVKKFVIHLVTIAYYEPSGESEFLQPIYVVGGDAYLDNDETAEFMFYIPAINYDTVTDKVVTEETSTDDTSSTVLDL